MNVPANTNGYVQFDVNGNLKGNVFAGYSTYAFKDSVTLTFTGMNMNTQNYFYKITHDTLTMSPGGAIFCIEGCANMFIKVGR
jgi:hypothetical protein